MDIYHHTRQKLQQTTLCNVYRPCEVSVESTGCTPEVKQQWLLIQQDNRYHQFHHAIIQDLIKEI